MKTRLASTLLLAMPLLAACDSDPFASPAAPAVAVRSFSYGAPVTAEGYLPGTDGVQIFYRVVGSGPDTTVVLTGGPGLAMGYLQPDLAPLAQGRTVVFYDPRGTGRSTLLFDPSKLGIQGHVADLESVRQHFGIETLTIVGHSWGAMVAPLYASQHPGRVERMVLVTPGPLTDEHEVVNDSVRRARTPDDVEAKQGELIGLLASGQSPDPVATCEELFSLFFPAMFADPANIANTRGRFCDEPPAAANALLLTMMAGRGSLGPSWDLAPMLATVSAPALVIHGAADAIPLSSTEGFAAALQNGELRVIQDAGHFPWLEQPVEFFTTVNTFLRRGDILN